MSLTITIDRIDGGRFRAEVAEDPRLVIEHGDLPGLIEELKQKLDMIVVTDDGKRLLLEFKTSDDTADAADRAQVEKTALRNEDLDELVDRYPVPAEWGDESGWSDVL
jgi:hypothetical protein